MWPRLAALGASIARFICDRWPFDGPTDCNNMIDQQASTSIPVQQVSITSSAATACHSDTSTAGPAAAIYRQQLKMKRYGIATSHRRSINATSIRVVHAWNRICWTAFAGFGIHMSGERSRPGSSVLMYGGYTHQHFPHSSIETYSHAWCTAADEATAPSRPVGKSVRTWACTCSYSGLV